MTNEQQDIYNTIKQGVNELKIEIQSLNEHCEVLEDERNALINLLNHLHSTSRVDLHELGLGVYIVEDDK
jgi:uncharacterized Rmd1/YagE family protein